MPIDWPYRRQACLWFLGCVLWGFFKVSDSYVRILGCPATRELKHNLKDDYGTIADKLHKYYVCMYLKFHTLVWVMDVQKVGMKINCQGILPDELGWKDSFNSFELSRVLDYYLAEPFEQIKHNFYFAPLSQITIKV